MACPFVVPGGLRMVMVSGHKALHLGLDLRAVGLRDRNNLGIRFLRDCMAAAVTLPSCRATSVAQAAVSVLRRPGDGELVDMRLIPAYHRLGGTDRFAVADALCAAFNKRGYRLSSAGLVRWAANDGLDSATLAVGRGFWARWGSPVDARHLANDPRFAVLLLPA